MTTKFAVAHSSFTDGRETGRELGSILMDKLGERPDVIITFISPDCDQQATLVSLNEICQPKN